MRPAPESGRRCAAAGRLDANRRFGSLAAVLLLSSACGALRPPAPDSGAPFDPDAARELIEQAASPIDETSYRANLRTDLDSPSGHVRGRSHVVLEPPDRARIDVLGPFGPIARIVVRGDDLVAWDAGASRWYVGSATAANLARLTGLPVDPALLPSLVRGRLPFAADEIASVEPDGEWIDVMTAGGGVWRVRPGGDGERIEAIAPDSATASIWFSDWEDEGDASVPKSLRVEVPARDTTITIRVTRVRLGEPAPDGAFDLEPPAGADVTRLE